MKLITVLRDSFLIENHFDVYNYDKKINVIIGNADVCNIRYFVSKNNDVIAKINFVKGNYVLFLNNSSVYVNNHIVQNQQKVLNYGDVISIFSLKIVF